MKPYLLYFNIFGTSQDIHDQFYWCLKSLKHSTPNPMFDIVVLSDEFAAPLLEKQKEVLDFTIYVVESLIPHRLMYRFSHIFSIPNINQYTALIYSDIDMLFMKNMNDMFEHPMSDNKVYAYGECLGQHNAYWYSVQNYTEEELEQLKDAYCLNSGFIVFKNTNVVKSIFNGIMMTYLEYTRNHLHHMFTDQSFFNMYCHKNKCVDTSLLQDKGKGGPDLNVKYDVYYIHFLGMGNRTKGKDMKCYYEKHFI